MARGTSRELALAIIVVGAMVLAAHSVGIVLCPLRRFVGVPCPGCGATRAVVHLFHGELAAAIRMNPLAVVLSAAIPVWWFFMRDMKLSRVACAIVCMVAVLAVAANWAYVLSCRP